MRPIDPAAAPPSASHSGHLLVIRLSALGDVAMTAPVLYALARSYPTVTLTMLTRPFFAPLFDAIPNCQVHDADVDRRHRGVGGLLKLLAELRAMSVDAVADLHNVLRSKAMRGLFLSLGKPFVSLDKVRSQTRALIRPRNKVFSSLPSVHHRYADVLARLGYPIDLTPNDTLTPPPLTPLALAAVGPKVAERWIGVAPFAAHPGKEYPADLMARVVDQLARHPGARILLFGGRTLREAGALHTLAAPYSNVKPLAGALPLRDELSLIAQLDVMLSMDSANAHLAALYGAPTITLWGVTHPYGGFYPFAQPMDHALLADRARYPLIPTSSYGSILPKGYEQAMRTIDPDRVVEKVLAKL